MNNRHGRAKFKNFRNILDSGCISTNAMGRLVEKLHPEIFSMNHWHTQAGNITTNHKVKVDFTLPTLSATNDVMWKCHVDESTKGRYDMMLGRYLLTELWLNFKFSEHVIEEDDRPFKWYSTLVVDLGMYTFKDFNRGKITPLELLTNSYA